MRRTFLLTLFPGDEDFSWGWSCYTKCAIRNVHFLLHETDISVEADHIIQNVQYEDFQKDSWDGHFFWGWSQNIHYARKFQLFSWDGDFSWGWSASHKTVGVSSLCNPFSLDISEMLQKLFQKCWKKVLFWPSSKHVKHSFNS